MRQLKPNVYEVGAIDWDRRLFDQLIPLPDGTSYNAYLIKGSEKIALIDTVDPTKTEVLVDNLIKSGIDRLDYVISHHAEQDHSGSLPDVLTLYPDAKIVTNAKCKQMLVDLLCINEKSFVVIKDGETLSLGDKTLQYFDIPWVHWPETIGTYLQEDKIFFPCDFFGAHIASNELFVKDEAVVYEAAKRYYAEIMMPFRANIKKNLEKIAPLDIQMIAPSHGQVYNKPKFIIDAYKDWISDSVKNMVLIPYLSMHGSTKKMVEYFVGALTERGIPVKQFDLVSADIGKIAITLVDAATVVIGTPTMLIGAHPVVAYAASLINALRPKTKFVSVISSFGWSEKAVEQIKGMLTNLKAEILEPVTAKGFPKDEDFAALDRLAKRIAEAHKRIGILS